MFDINKPIETIEAVADLAKYLYNERKVAFHPDDPFEEYCDMETDTRTFTDEEAAALNARMDECFDVCEAAGEDIYALMSSFNPMVAYLKENSDI